MMNAVSVPQGQPTTPPRQPANLQQQAEYIDYILDRCVMRDGSMAGEAMLLLDQGDMAELKAIAGRLHRIAPFEKEIRRLVTGR